MNEIVKYDYGKLEKIETVQRSVLRIKSIEQALEKRKLMPTLVKMKLDIGFEKTSSYIELLILKLNEFFNVKEKMSPAQIRETAAMIIEEYYFLSFIEIIFILKEAKLGRYGEMYGSIDGHKILRWFIKYTDERFDAIEKQKESERLANKFGGNAAERISTSTDFKKINKFKNDTK